MAEFKLKKGQKVYHIREFSSVLELARRKLIGPDDPIYVPLAGRWVYAKAIQELRPLLQEPDQIGDDAFELPLEFVEPLAEDIGGGLTIEMDAASMGIGVSAFERQLEPLSVGARPGELTRRPPSSPAVHVPPPPSDDDWDDRPTVVGAIRPPPARRAEQLWPAPSKVANRPARTPDPLWGNSGRARDPLAVPDYVRPPDVGRQHDPLAIPDYVRPPEPVRAPEPDRVPAHIARALEYPRSGGSSRESERGYGREGDPGSRGREGDPGSRGRDGDTNGRGRELEPGSRGRDSDTNGRGRELEPGPRNRETDPGTRGRDYDPVGRSNRELAAESARQAESGGGARSWANGGTERPRELRLKDDPVVDLMDPEAGGEGASHRPGNSSRKMGPVPFQHWMQEQARKSGGTVDHGELVPVIKVARDPKKASRFSWIRVALALAVVVILFSLITFWVRSTSELEFKPLSTAQSPVMPPAGTGGGAPDVDPGLVPPEPVTDPVVAASDDLHLRDMLRPQTMPLRTFDQAQDELFGELLNLKVAVADVHLEPVSGDRGKSVRTSDADLTVRLKEGKLTFDQQSGLVGLVVGKYVKHNKLVIRTLILQIEPPNEAPVIRRVSGEAAGEYFARVQDYHQFLLAMQSGTQLR